MTRPPFTLEKHLPERRRQPIDVTLHCGCCCCCCCCLHTIGGLIGASVAPAIGKGDRLPLYYYYEEEDDYLPVRPRGPSAVALAWWILLGLSGAGLFFGVGLSSMNLHSPWEAGGNLLVALVILAMVFPAVQLLAIIFAFLAMAFQTRPDKSSQLRQLAKMTLGLILGAFVGLLAMVIAGFALATLW